MSRKIIYTCDWCGNLIKESGINMVTISGHEGDEYNYHKSVCFDEYVKRKKEIEKEVADLYKY